VAPESLAQPTNRSLLISVCSQTTLAVQTDDMFEIKADVPGVSKQNIKVRNTI
jgi:HSP20 family molecular chaperone IbpA